MSTSSRWVGPSRRPARGPRPSAPAPPLLPSPAMEIMGIQIRTIVDGQRRDALRRLPRGHRGHALAGQPARHRRGRDAGRLDRAAGDQSRAVPVPRRPRLRPALDGRQGLPVLPARRGPRDHAPGPDPGRRRRALGPVRRHPPRRPRVRPGLTARPRGRRRAATDALDAVRRGPILRPLSESAYPDLPRFRVAVTVDGSVSSVSPRRSPDPSALPLPSVPPVPVSTASARPTRPARRPHRGGPLAVARAGEPAGRRRSRTRSAAGPTRAASRCTSTPGGHRRFDRRALERCCDVVRHGRGTGRRAAGQPRREPRAADPRLPAQLHAPTRAAPPAAADDVGDRERTARTAAGWSTPSSPTSTPTARRGRHGARPRPMPRRSSTTSPGGSRPPARSLTEAVALFVAARRPFLAELTGLGRRRTLDAARLGALYDDASALLDRLLLRLIATYQAGGALTVDPRIVAPGRSPRSSPSSSRWRCSTSGASAAAASSSSGPSGCCSTASAPACEAIGGASGWNEALYRTWYLTGAVWTAGWLGLGTAFLLGRTRFGYSFALCLFLAGLFTFLRPQQARVRRAPAPCRCCTSSSPALLALAVAVETYFHNDRWPMLAAGGGRRGDRALSLVLMLTTTLAAPGLRARPGDRRPGRDALPAAAPAADAVPEHHRRVRADPRARSSRPTCSCPSGASSPTRSTRTSRATSSCSTCSSRRSRSPSTSSRRCPARSGRWSRAGSTAACRRRS